MSCIKKKLNDASIIELSVEPDDNDLIMIVVNGIAKKMTYSSFKSNILVSGNISGLGTMATQDSDSVAISGGSINGIVDLSVADGGTGASTAVDARSNLGLVIGSDIQAYDSDLESIANLTPSKGRILVGDGSNWNVLNPGTDGQIITYDSAEVVGLKAETINNAPISATYITQTPRS